MMRLKCAVIFAGFFLALATAADCARNPRTQSARHDGYWWTSVSPAERSGFVDGYFDCYVFEYKGSLKFRRYSRIRYGEMASGFYRNTSPNKLQKHVIDVLASFSDPAGFTPSEKGVEPPHGQRGGDDGLYWIGLGINGTSQQTGFIEGYLDCHVNLNHNRGGSFSKSPSYYPPLITHWYRIDQKTGYADPNRQSASIASVLFKFRDEAPKRGTAKK
jgi:hypothetical protein